MTSAFDPAAFIRAETTPAAPPIVPELMLYLASDVTPLWQSTEARLEQERLPPPYWAFAWAGGQGLARYMLDHPEVVRLKRVIDFAAGGGIGALAAMKAGAVSVTAIEIDPLAIAALRLNAELNQVSIRIDTMIDMEKAPKNVDLITVGDVCYEQAMTARLMRWLWICVAAGIRVIMGDPGRAYVPTSGLTKLASYTVPTTVDLEGVASREVTVWDVGSPVEE